MQNGTTRPARRLVELLRADLAALRLRLRAGSFLAWFMPYATLGWLRPVCYRMAGVRIGARARILGSLMITGEGPIAAHVRIGADCLLTTPLLLNASAPITIGDHVTIGHHVILITDNHEYDNPRHRGGRRRSLPIVVKDGVWICAGATILPGVTLGYGSVVAAGAVVTRDVPSHTLVGGVPARVLKRLKPDTPRLEPLAVTLVNA